MTSTENPSTGSQQRLDDASLQRELAERVLPTLRRYLERHVGQHLRGHESVSDLAQSVCREALRDIDSFRGAAAPQFHAWIRKIAANKIARRHRYWSADVRQRCAIEGDLGARVDPDSPSASQMVHRREVREALRDALEALPEHYRIAIETVGLRGASHRDLAEKLGTNEVAARKVLSRARARLGLLLAAHQDDEPGAAERGDDGS